MLALLWGSGRRKGTSSRHSLCPGPADDEGKVSVGSGGAVTDARHLPVMAFHLYSLSAAQSLIPSQCLSSPKDVQNPNAVGMDRGSLCTWAQELIGNCCSGGTLKSIHLQAWKSLLNCHCTPLFPPVALYFPLRAAQPPQPPFQSCFLPCFPSRREACGELSFTQQLQLVNGG